MCCRLGTGLHLINTSLLIKNFTLRHYLEKLYTDNTFDTEFTETSDNVRENKTSIIINEIDDKVVVRNGLVT